MSVLKEKPTIGGSILITFHDMKVHMVFVEAGPALLYISPYYSKHEFFIHCISDVAKWQAPWAALVGGNFKSHVLIS